MTIVILGLMGLCILLGVLTFKEAATILIRAFLVWLVLVAIAVVWWFGLFAWVTRAVL